MLSAYDLSTDQSRRNATFEVNQQSYLPVYIKADSLIRRHSMAEPACASFTDWSASAKTWTFRC